ncbi:MAG: response regulator transcription factor [Treponema sp.]|nr:response regulator transcription factor [Treponema sp.]
MRKIRVMIASKMEEDRKELAALLARHDDFEAAIEARDSFDALSSSARERADVLAIDLWLDVPGTLELAPAIRRRSPGTAIVALVSPEDRVSVRQALGAGISGYFLRGCDTERFALCMRSAYFGAPYVSEAALRQAVGCAPEREGSSTNFFEIFSATEAQIIRGVLLGLSDPEIARELHICEGTVRNCICSARKKTGLKNRAQIGAYALSAGLMAGESDLPWLAQGLGQKAAP